MNFKVILLSLLLIPLTTFSTLQAEGVFDLRDNLKGVLEHQLSKLLQQEVTIGEIKGNIYNHIILHDVTVKSRTALTEKVLLFTPKVEVDYSLKRILADRLNVLPHLRRVAIHEPFIALSRDQDGNWEGITKVSGNGVAKQVELPESLEVRVVGGRGLYTDYRGFGPIKKDFLLKTELRQINGLLEIKDGDLNVTLGAELPGQVRYNTLLLSGKVGLKEPTMQLKLSTKDLDLKTWGRYMLPINFAHLHRGQADIALLLDKPKGGSANLVAELKLTETILELPTISKRFLYGVKGGVRITDNTIFLQNLSGYLDGSPVHINGPIYNYRAQKNLRLDLTMKEVELAKLPDYLVFRVLDNFPSKLGGKFDMQLAIRGTPKDLRLSSKVESKQLNFYSYKLAAVKAVWGYHSNAVTVTINSSRLASGNVSGQLLIAKESGQWGFRSGSALTITSANLQELTYGEGSGPLSAAVSMSGPLQDLVIDITGQGEVTLLGQAVVSPSCKLLHRNNRYLFRPFKAVVNGEPLTLKAELDSSQKLRVQLEGQSMLLKKGDYFSNLNALFLIRGRAYGFVETSFPQVGPTLRANLTVGLTDSIIGNETIEQGSFNLIVQDQKIALDKIQLDLPNRGQLRGRFKGDLKAGSGYLHLNSQSSLSLEQIAIVQSYLPASQGRLNLSGTIEHQRGGKLSLKLPLELEDFQYRDVSLNRLSLTLEMAEGLVTISGGELLVGRDSYKGAGHWQLEEGEGSLEVAIERAELQRASLLFQRINRITNELQKSWAPSAQESNMTRHPQALLLMAPAEPLYSAGQSSAALQRFAKLQSDIKPEPTATPLTSALSGRLSGRLRASYLDEKLVLDGDLSLSDGKLGRAEVKRVALKLDSVTENIQLNLLANNLTVGQSSYPNLLLKARYDGSTLYNISLQAPYREGTTELLKGQLPLAAWLAQEDAGLQLTALLEGRELALLAGLIPGVREAEATGKLAVELGGSLMTPNLTIAKGSLQELTFKTLNPNYQEVKLANAVFNGHPNGLQLEKLQLNFRGKEGSSPDFNLKGELSLANWSLLASQGSLLKSRLSLEDGSGKVVLAPLFKGNLKWQEITLKGQLPIGNNQQSELAERLILKGELWLSDAKFNLSSGVGGAIGGHTLRQKLKPQGNEVALDLAINSGENVSLSSRGSLQKGDISALLGGFDIELANPNEQVQLKGTLNHPSFEGRFYMDNGSFSFLGRRFTLLSPSEQENFFSRGIRETIDNYLELVPTADLLHALKINGVMHTSIIETVSSVNTTADEVTDNTNAVVLVQRSKHYLLFIDGSPIEPASLSFRRYLTSGLSYVQDGEEYILQDKESGELIDPLRFQELATDIAPEFVKVAMGANNQAQLGQSFTEEIAKELTIDTVNSRMRDLLRPLEKSLGRQANLYDVKIKRDFGLDAVRMLSLDNSQSPAVEQYGLTDQYNQELGLSLVKELIPRSIYLYADAGLDRSLQSELLYMHMNSYGVNWKFFNAPGFDEVSLGIGQELDLYFEEYRPVMLLEGLRQF